MDETEMKSLAISQEMQELDKIEKLVKAAVKQTKRAKNLLDEFFSSRDYRFDKNIISKYALLDTIETPDDLLDLIDEIRDCVDP